MWKLLKALPKSWRNKVFSPLGSNPCPDDDDDGGSCRFDKQAIAGAAVICTCMDNNEKSRTCSARDAEERAGPKFGKDTVGRCPFQRTYGASKWMSILMCRRDRYDIAKQDFFRFPMLETFCLWFHFLVKRKYGIVALPDCGHHHDGKQKLCYRLYRTLSESARHSLSSSTTLAVLPGGLSSGDTSGGTTTAYAAQTERVADLSKTDSSQISEVPPLAEDLLSSLQDVAATYAAHVFNGRAKELAKEGQNDRALVMFREARTLGLAEASFNIGVCYESGLGVEQDAHQAFRYYEEAAAGGHGGAMYNLAVFYLRGRGVDADEKLGRQYMEMASQAGIRQAQTYLGVHYGRLANYKRSVDMFRKAAGQEDPEGQYYLGLCFEKGLGVTGNLKKAAELYCRAESAGNVEACYRLATFHERGLGGLAEDKTRAHLFYKKAANRGHKLAAEKIKWESEEEDESVVFEDSAPSRESERQRSATRSMTSDSEFSTSASSVTSSRSSSISLQLNFSAPRGFMNLYHQVSESEDDESASYDRERFQISANAETSLLLGH